MANRGALIIFGHRWSELLCIVVIVLITTSCTVEPKFPKNPDRPYVVVLGIAQDAGFPQANCQKPCCASAWGDMSKRRMVSSLGIVDPVTKKAWIIDATPDFKDQLQVLLNHGNGGYSLSGIFLTHAHIGHYTGLMHLGREVMGTDKVPVYVMPRMKDFLQNNGPWSQLVDLQNINLVQLKNDSSIVLSSGLTISPVKVPHRDEFSETVGYSLKGTERSLLFIPDIDKWSKWEKKLTGQVVIYDALLIDGSFYANGEIPNRDMSEIPHPFVVETMEILKDLELSEKNKVHFIHLNHTNPLLNPDGQEIRQIRSLGFNLSEEGDIIVL